MNVIKKRELVATSFDIGITTDTYVLALFIFSIYLYTYCDRYGLQRAVVLVHTNSQ